MYLWIVLGETPKYSAIAFLVILPLLFMSFLSSSSLKEGWVPLLSVIAFIECQTALSTASHDLFVKRNDDIIDIVVVDVKALFFCNQKKLA